MWLVKSTILLLVAFYIANAARLPLGHGLQEGPNVSQGGMVIVGDMIVPENRLQQFPFIVRKVVARDDSIWPNDNGVPTVPFVISNLFYANQIRNAMKHWEENTCIRFREIDGDYEGDYVDFILDQGCWSYVGRIRTGKQLISIGHGCQSLGTVAHEIGHAIGFFHEQNRPDRDSYITIDYENIDSDFWPQFDKLSGSMASTDVEYDYTSIMQYAGKDFSSTGKLTMIAKNPQHQGLLGSGEVLSFRDKLAVNSKYGCIEMWERRCNIPEGQCQNGGYLGQHCQCVCPPGTAGDNCQTQIGSFYDDVIPECSRIITEETIISSPNYPANIPVGTWCVYEIQAPDGHIIELNFEEFSLEIYDPSREATRCLTAFLEIRSHTNNAGSVFCGRDMKDELVFSKSGKMILYLDAPYSSNSLGFKAKVSFIETESDSKIVTTSEETNNHIKEAHEKDIAEVNMTESLTNIVASTEGAIGNANERTTEGSASIPRPSFIYSILFICLFTLFL